MKTSLQTVSTHTADDHSHPSDPIAFELGWDFARHSTSLPVPYAAEDSVLRHGWLAGQAAFGERARSSTPQVVRWLELRLRAWLRGRHVELMQVTPHLLKQLSVTHCPITRATLSDSGSNQFSIDRVRDDAAYAAGNLGMMSLRANHAKGSKNWAQALEVAARVASENQGGHDGLTAAQWHRVATWCSFVEPLSHAQACQIPLRVLPPNRLRLFNPVQALQVFISQQLLSPGWSHRISRFESLLQGSALRRDFNRFFMAFLPRVLEAGKTDSPLHARWAIEDAWAHAGVLQRWTQFAQQLTPQQCETLLQRAHARHLGTCRIEHQDASQATDGWQLDTRGYMPASLPTSQLMQAIQLALPV